MNVDEAVEQQVSRMSKGEIIRSAVDHIRYNPRVIRMGLWQSIKHFFIARTYRWTRTRMVLDAVYPGQPGYESAHYEAGFIWQRKDRL